MRIRAGIAWIVMLLAAPPVAARAQSALVGSIPSAGAVLPPGAFDVHLRFDALVDRERSRLFLTDPNGSTEYLVIFKEGSPKELAALARLGAGAYVLHWDAFSADGHIASGSLSFKVKER